MSQFLDKIRNAAKRPMTRERLGFWIGIVGGKLLGRRLQCVRCGRSYHRTFPAVYRGKVYLLGLHADFVRPVFSSQHELGFECITCGPQVTGQDTPPAVESPAPAAPKKIKQVVLGHYVPGQTEPVLSYIQDLAEGVPVTLIYGGKPENFEKIEWDSKVFAPDPNLRGPTSEQNHRGLVKTIASVIDESMDDEDWVLFSEADCIPLERDYARQTVRVIEEAGGDFAACHLTNDTGTNADWYQRETKKPGWLETLSAGAPRGQRPQVFHSLGCIMLFRVRFLRKWMEYKHPEASVYFEIYIPTFAHYAGLKLVNFNAVSKRFDFCRYRPEYSVEEIPGALEKNALFMHPAKWDADVLRSIPRPKSTAVAAS